MSAVTSSALRFTFAGLKTIFDDAYKRRIENTIYKTVASVVETTLPNQDFAMLGNLPAMRQWIGKREENGFGQLFPTYTIPVLKWEDTLSIGRTLIEDDQYGEVKMRAMDLGIEPIVHKEQLVLQALAAGASNYGMDPNNYFFSATHSESGTNQVNTETSFPLTGANLATALGIMWQYTDNQGRPMYIHPDTLVVGPANTINADQIVHSTLVVSGNTSQTYGLGNKNPLSNIANVLTTPWFTGAYANYWALLDTSRSVKPMILLERSDVPVEFTMRFNPDDPRVFDNDEYLAGIRARYAVGYGLWQCAFLGQD